MKFPAPGLIELRGMMIIGYVHNFLQEQTLKNYCLAIKDISMITSAEAAGTIQIMLRNGVVLETEKESFKANHPQNGVNALATIMKAIDAHLKTIWVAKQKIKNQVAG